MKFLAFWHFAWLEKLPFGLFERKGGVQTVKIKAKMKKKLPLRAKCWMFCSQSTNLWQKLGSLFRNPCCADFVSIQLDLLPKPHAVVEFSTSFRFHLSKARVQTRNGFLTASNRLSNGQWTHTLGSSTVGTNGNQQARGGKTPSKTLR